VFDDLTNITNNEQIRVQEASLSRIVTASFKANATRPVAMASLIVNYVIHGYDPVGYHVVNIAIHAAVALLLFFILRRTLEFAPAVVAPNRVVWMAFFSSLLWVVHPVHTQSVTYIVQRMNSMAALFMLASLWCYINGRTAQDGYRSWLWFSGSLASWLMALGCKENSVMLPVLMFIYEWFFFQDLSRTWLRRQLKWIGVAAVVCALATAILLGSDPVGRIGSLRDFSESRFTYAERVLTQPRVVMHYLSLFVLPHPSRLNLDYDFPLSHGIFDPPTTLLAIVAIAALMGIGIVVARRHRLLAFAIFWFFATLVVESSVIPLAIIFEHRTYVPFMALAPMVVWAVFRIPGPKALPVLLLLVISALFSVWTWQRNSVWADPIRLWSNVIAKSPGKARPHHKLGDAYSGRGNVKAAIDLYRKAIELDPTFTESYNNLGLLMAEQADIESAERLYQKAIGLAPGSLDVINNYAVLLINQGRAEESISLLSQALKLNPGYKATYVNLGAAWMLLDDPESAEAAYRKALELDRRSTHALTGLAGVLLFKKEFDAASELLRNALAIDPDNPEARIGLAEAMIAKGNYDTAMMQLKQALRQVPEDIRANELLLAVTLKKGDVQQLENQLRRLLDLDPDHVEANTNMGGILTGRGDIDGAIYHLQQVLNQDPAHAEALNNMGIALAYNGQYANAGDAFLAAIRSRPEFADAWDNLFYLGRAAGPRWDMAAALRRHTGDHPENPESYVIFGEFYLRRGDTPRAKAEFERALDLDPDNARARERLSTIN